MKMMKWSCTNCGMSSGRRYSVQRHIDNYNIHNGEGKVIPFVLYAVGRREVIYQEHQRSETSSESHNFLDGILVKISRELEELIAKDVASRIYRDLLADQTQLENLKALAIPYIIKKNYFRNIKELARS